jgi:hypothetical protein
MWATHVLDRATQLAATLERPYADLPVNATQERERRRLNHIRHFRPMPFPTHLVRWSTCDNIQRVFDDYCEDASECEPTMVLCVLAFLLGLSGDGPGTLPYAVARLHDSIEIILLCDELLVALDHDDPHSGVGIRGVWPRGTKPGKAPRLLPAKPPKTLIEALTGDEHRGDAAFAIQAFSMADLQAELRERLCAL